MTNKTSYQMLLGVCKTKYGAESGHNHTVLLEGFGGSIRAAVTVSPMRMLTKFDQFLSSPACQSTQLCSHRDTTGLLIKLTLWSFATWCHSSAILPGSCNATGVQEILLLFLQPPMAAFLFCTIDNCSSREGVSSQRQYFSFSLWVVGLPCVRQYIV